MEFGSRIPAFWIGEGGFNHITCALDQNTGIYSFNVDDSEKRFNTGDWVNVKLSQINGVFEYKVNGEIVHTAINSDPQTWTNVKVVMGNRFGYHDRKIALGQYRNFKINSRPGQTAISL